MQRNLLLETVFVRRSLTRQKTYKSESTRREVREEYIGGCLVAFRGEEGRNKLRKAAGIGKYELIRRYPNGGTR